MLVYVVFCVLFFFFKQKTAYEMRISDWSSDVCSSDLLELFDLIEMIGRDDPIPIGLALDAATDLPHRFETAEMGFGEALAGGGIVLQMGVDRVAPAIGGGDQIGRARV